MPTYLHKEDSTNNSFAVSFTIAMNMLTGFVVAASGITLASPALAFTGLVILLAALSLYALLLV